MEILWILTLKKNPSRATASVEAQNKQIAIILLHVLLASSHVAQEIFKQEMMVLCLVAPDWVFFHDVLQTISKSVYMYESQCCKHVQGFNMCYGTKS